jgi:hypothetical protein
MLMFVSTLLYWDSVCCVRHFLPWWADDRHVERALLEARTAASLRYSYKLSKVLILLPSAVHIRVIDIWS